MTQIIASIGELTALRDELRRGREQRTAAGHQEIRICMGASCIASGALKVKEAIEKELASRALDKRVPLVGTGCLGPCRRRPGTVGRRRVLPQPETAGLRGDRVRARGAGADRGAPDAQAARRPQRAPYRRDRLLPPANEDRAAELRGHRSGAGRRLHRVRRLPGPGPGAAAEQCQGGDRNAAHLRAAGPGRGRLSDLAEVEGHPRGAGRDQVRCLQRRRRRPGRVHGSQRPGGRPAQRDRGHDRGRVHDRGRARVPVRPRRVSPGGPALADRPAAVPGARAVGAEHPGQRLRLRVGDPHGFRGLRVRRGDGAVDVRSRGIGASRGPARPFPPRAACGASPRC